MTLKKARKPVPKAQSPKPERSKTSEKAVRDRSRGVTTPAKKKVRRARHAGAAPKDAAPIKQSTPSAPKRRDRRVTVADRFSLAKRRGGGAGFGVAAAVVEGSAAGWDQADVTVDQTRGGEGGGRKGTRALGGLATPSRINRSTQVFAALGHPARVEILLHLLQGPATYADLKAHTRLAAGPLYHHLTQLRAASLILPKKRDTYAMTRGGRNALLLGLAAVPMISDRRARPPIGR